MARARVFFISNRNLQPDNKTAVFGARFNPDGVAALRYGWADFEPGAGRAAQVNVYSETPAKDPAGGFIKVGSAAFFDDLKAQMSKGGRDTVVFIHGFNESFSDALLAASRISTQTIINGKPVNVVVFSWPSDGKMIPWMSYYSDRDDARSSGAAVARAFLKLVDFFGEMPEAEVCGQALHLLAHSMGAYVLRNGLQALIAKDPTRLLRVFQEIILAAPDEDDDAFETDQKLRLLPRLGRRVTVYHNEGDRALFISDKTKANPDRLGADGPRMLDLLPKKVVTVDCSRVAATADATSRHTFFINCPPVSADLGATLHGVDSALIPNRDVIRAERAYRIRG
ncbi:alpha/beta hydrolase [Sphingomonas alba]|uniref:Alpha/beta fold hydrolase n=1 Tax=Sphingomonas alba TaxID=2908208 RepID=A0ABT0RKM3_9SPHN|nr:alpha/beta fold hydrolase [Sphingomonas alba]MCL6683002.1 alpha/beta fold hydrolase [Sphingomonas alba]